MRIVDWAPYVMGNKSPWELKKEPYRADYEGMKLGVNLLEIHPTAKDNLKVIKLPRLFYAREPDMANDIPKHMRDEIFYALKIGRYSSQVPAKLMYFISTAFKEYGSPNFVFKITMEKDMEEFLSSGYLSGGYTMRDVICSETKIHDYTPLAEGRFAVKVGEHWDLYIEEKDAIAMVPEDLRNLLSQDDIASLRVAGSRLVLGKKPISQLGRYVGAVNSTYDLRRLL